MWIRGSCSPRRHGRISSSHNACWVFQQPNLSRNPRPFCWLTATHHSRPVSSALNLNWWHLVWTQFYPGCVKIILTSDKLIVNWGWASISEVVQGTFQRYDGNYFRIGKSWLLFCPVEGNKIWSQNGMCPRCVQRTFHIGLTAGGQTESCLKHDLTTGVHTLWSAQKNLGKKNLKGRNRSCRSWRERHSS